MSDPLFHGLRNGTVKDSLSQSSRSIRSGGTDSAGSEPSALKCNIFVFNVKLELEAKSLYISEDLGRFVLRDYGGDVGQLIAESGVETDLVSAEASELKTSEFELSSLMNIQIGYRAQFVRYLHPFTPPAELLLTFKFKSGLLGIRFLSREDRQQVLTILESAHRGIELLD